MRDEIDARLWNEHHEQFSEWLDGAVSASVRRLRQLSARGGAVPEQLFATLAAAALTLLTVTASAA